MARRGDVGTVLLVESDREERARFGTWLEGAGYDVLECPGPSGPDYSCVGSRDRACPLAMAADVIVLDMSLESEALMLGTASEDLLGLYLMAGRSVVALGSHPGSGVPGQLTRLRRHPDRDDLVDAVAALAAAR
jgi:CheY-like chemotaxis protein